MPARVDYFRDEGECPHHRRLHPLHHRIFKRRNDLPHHNARFPEIIDNLLSPAQARHPCLVLVILALHEIDGPADVIPHLPFVARQPLAALSFALIAVDAEATDIARFRRFSNRVHQHAACEIIVLPVEVRALDAPSPRHCAGAAEDPSPTRWPCRNGTFDPSPGI